jgi:hypothetical protein
MAIVSNKPREKQAPDQEAADHSQVEAAAQQAYIAGLTVLPAKNDGSKRPDLESWAQYQTRQPTPDEWLAMKFEDGLGLVVGRDVEVWDFDCPDTFEKFIETAEALGLGSLVDRIRSGYEELTPFGGRHWLVKLPAGVTWKRETLATRLAEDGQAGKVRIELPLWVVTAPSNGRTHPSGKAYKRISGDFNSIASYTAEERDELMALARYFDERPKREFTPKTAPTTVGDRPGDRFNSEATWPSILEPAGWVHVCDRDEKSYWRRPGKSVGVSATVNFGDSGLLYVFTPNAPSFEANCSYSKFAAHTLLNHHGDFSAAARALRDTMKTDKTTSSPRPRTGISAKTSESTAVKPMELLSDPELFEKIKDIIRARGYAGDVRPPMIAYFAFTSRLLPRPLNVNFVAPSSAGKNKAVNSAKELIPDEAYHYISAGSQRALIFSEEDFQHRVVVMAEADSISDEGSAGSAMRALAEDNKLVYEVTEKNDGKHETRRIHKDGPTGLITTSTKRLARQMNTRVLEVSISDGPKQTRDVVRAHAQTVMPDALSKLPAVTPFLDVQRWLEQTGECRVVIPFAEVLADLVPVHEVRMRRDFRQLLTVIQTSALLYQAQRERTKDGEIIATLEDYKIARWLLSAVFDAISEDGLTPAVRETVEAIKPGEIISQAELVTRLGLAKGTVSERVKIAVDRGWLTKEGKGNGRPALLQHGEPMPEAGSALPTVESVRVKLTEPGAERFFRTVKLREFRPKNAKSDQSVRTVRTVFRDSV